MQLSILALHPTIPVLHEMFLALHLTILALHEMFLALHEMIPAQELTHESQESPRAL